MGTGFHGDDFRYAANTDIVIGEARPADLLEKQE